MKTTTQPQQPSRDTTAPRISIYEMALGEAITKCDALERHERFNDRNVLAAAWARRAAKLRDIARHLDREAA